MFKSMIKPYLVAFAAGSSVIPCVFADENVSTSVGRLEEIVVTAERRESDVQNTASSISVRSGDTLRQEGKYSLQQILGDIPNVAVTEPNPTGGFAAGSDTVGGTVVIRGMSSNDPLGTVSGVPTTAVYTDGVYEGIGGSYDIDRVEVLRGPQGTLYGRSATAGVVATHTRNPVLSVFGGDATAEFGNYSLQHFTGAINVPLGDKVALRASANKYERDGYYSSDGGARESTAGRLKLLYRPNDDLSILFGAALEKNDINTGGKVGRETSPGVVEYESVPVFKSDNSWKQYWADINWNFGPATLTYLPAFRSWDQDAPQYNSGPGQNTLVVTVKTPLDEFTTHELRLASNDDSKLTWLIGAMYYKNRLHTTNSARYYVSGGLLSAYEVEKETKDIGYFAELTYLLTDVTRLTAGARYDDTRVQVGESYTANANLICYTSYAPFGCPLGPLTAPPGSPNAGLPEDNVTAVLSPEDGIRKFHNFTFKLRLEHDLTPANMLYAMASSGFLPGDVQINTGENNQPVTRTYNEETLTSYEIGSKNRFLNGTLQLNASAFYYDYGGFQQFRTPDPLDPGAGFVDTVPAKMLGGELELLWQFTRSDRLGLSYAYVNAEYVNTSEDFKATVAQTRIPDVTPHMFNASYAHTFRLPNESSLVLHADARFTSSHLIETLNPSQVAQGGEPYVTVDAAWIGNVSGTWNSAAGHYSVTGYVRNVGDFRYLTYVGVQSVSPPDITAAESEPRTYGAVLSVHF